MLTKVDILKKLTSSKISLVGDLVEDLGQENSIIAFVEINHDAKGNQIPSISKFNLLSVYFEENETSLSFVYIKKGIENIQSVIKDSLFRRFPNIIGNVFLSLTEKGEIDVWLEPKKILEKSKSDEVRANIFEVFKLLSSNLNEIKITSSENLPSSTACLVSIRKGSPISLESLEQSLIQRGFQIPNLKWLSSILDKLRKNQFILRKDNGQFVLTLKALSALGSQKSRNSHDIIRVLDLARRGS